MIYGLEKGFLCSKSDVSLQMCFIKFYLSKHGFTSYLAFISRIGNIWHIIIVVILKYVYLKDMFEYFSSMIMF